MHTGHFAIGLIGKRLEPKLSLGTLFLASLLCDLLWCVFMIAGIEHVRIRPGITITPGMRAIDVLEASEIAYSHSLLMTAVWGVLLGLLYFSWRRNRRAAWVLVAAVLSHWVLDVISHPPDMPLMPGAVQQRFGLGLWNSIPATLVIEGAVWTVAVILYVRAARPTSRVGSFVFWIGVFVITAAWIGNITGPPPANLSTIGFSSLTYFSITVGWAYWTNRTRVAT
jgi:membrane-bound metal-dependent hydrolase YbcI (DUF457 family)